MKRTITMLMAALAAMVMIAPALAAPMGTRTIFSFDFQKGTLDPWNAATVNGGLPAKNALTLQTDGLTASLGANSYAVLTRDTADFTTMQGKLVAAGHLVTVDLQAREMSGCMGCILLVYAGRTAPVSVAQFTANYQGLTSDWTRLKTQVRIMDTNKSIKTVADMTQPGGNTLVVALAYVVLDGGELGMLMKQQVAFDNINITVEDR